MGWWQYPPPPSSWEKMGFNQFLAGRRTYMMTGEDGARPVSCWKTFIPDDRRRWGSTSFLLEDIHTWSKTWTAPSASPPAVLSSDTWLWLCVKGWHGSLAGLGRLEASAWPEARPQTSQTAPSWQLLEFLSSVCESAIGMWKFTMWVIEKHNAGRLCKTQ